MHFKLITFSTKLCTIGNWYHDDDLICHTMEKPWLQNKNDISCIPAGLYDMHYRVSPKKGPTFYFSNKRLGVTLDSPGTRTYIQIDKANVQSELLGCIAVGRDFGFMKGEQAVTHSKETKALLMGILNKSSHTIEIKRY